MFLSGEFKDNEGRTVRVEITTSDNPAAVVEIGGESGINFDSDAVHVDCEVNDTLDHLIRHSATIRLQTDRFIPGLYCSNCVQVPVKIFREGECMFSGYVEPQTYTQEFNSVSDILEINCIDALSALQYSRYSDIGRAGVDYFSKKSEAENRSFLYLLDHTLARVSGGDIFFDGSVKLSLSNPVFENTFISELLFYGKEEDDVWTHLEVVEEIMRYLNLRMTQLGEDFFIFSWQSVRAASREFEWTSLKSGDTRTEAVPVIDIDMENVYDADTSITVGEVYNRIELTDKITEIDNVVESPLSKDSLYSPYAGRQLYLTLLAARTNFPRRELRLILEDGYSFLKDTVMQHWFIRVKDNPRWKFYESNPHKLLTPRTDGKYQDHMPDNIKLHGGAGLIAMGKVEYDSSYGTDSSAKPKLDMEDYFVISVNGNENDSQTECYPQPRNLLANAPRAEYVGRVSGGVFSPADSETTNYIVISGDIILNPITHQTYDARYILDEKEIYSNFGTGKSEIWRDKAYNTCYRWWRCETPFSTPEDDFEVNYLLPEGLMPFTGIGPQLYEYERHYRGSFNDHVDQIPVLACMLVIGNKRVRQWFMKDERGVIVPHYEWVAYKTHEECASDEEYYSQSFTIGFNPKIEDKLVGTSFKIENNIDYSMDLDMEGLAIPIKQNDHLSGTVDFKVLGIVAMTWNNKEVKTGKEWYLYPEEWASGDIPLFAHVSSVFIKNFEIKVCSDNGHITSTDEDDLVFMSDTDEDFVNVKDDLEFRFTSALTPEERSALGFPGTVNLSTPVVKDTTGKVSALLRIFASGMQEKPEKLYVDSVYSEFHKPRVSLDQGIRDVDGVASILGHYRHPALPGKVFHTVGISRNLAEGTARLNLKEISDD